MKTIFDTKGQLSKRIDFYDDGEKDIRYIEEYKNGFLFKKIYYINEYNKNNIRNNIRAMKYFKKSFKFFYKIVYYEYYYDENNKSIDFIRYNDENGHCLKIERYKDNKIIDVEINKV